MYHVGKEGGPGSRSKPPNQDDELRRRHARQPVHLIWTAWNNKNYLETFNNISKAGGIGSKDIPTLNGHPFWFKQHIQLQKHNLIHIIRFKESNLYIKHFSCNIVSKQLKIQYIDRF